MKNETNSTYEQLRIARAKLSAIIAIYGHDRTNTLLEAEERLQRIYDRLGGIVIKKGL